MVLKDTPHSEFPTSRLFASGLSEWYKFINNREYEMTVGLATALANGVANLFQREVSISRRNSWRGDLTLKVAVVIAWTSFSYASAGQPDEKPIGGQSEPIARFSP